MSGRPPRSSSPSPGWPRNLAAGPLGECVAASARSSAAANRGYGVEIEGGLYTNEHEERLAKNEVLFRTVNEAIEQQALRFGGIDDEYEFICECSSTECVEKMTLTLRQYEQIRAEGTHFLLVPGHADPGLELVVERTANHHVVEKDGAAGIVAEQGDPRSAQTQSDFEPRA